MFHIWTGEEPRRTAKEVNEYYEKKIEALKYRMLPPTLLFAEIEHYRKCQAMELQALGEGLPVISGDIIEIKFSLKEED